MAHGMHWPVPRQWSASERGSRLKGLHQESEHVVFNRAFLHHRDKEDGIEVKKQMRRRLWSPCSLAKTENACTERNVRKDLHVLRFDQPWHFQTEKPDPEHLTEKIIRSLAFHQFFETFYFVIDVILLANFNTPISQRRCRGFRGLFPDSPDSFLNGSVSSISSVSLK